MILLIGLVVIVCAGLLVLGFLAPRLSRRVQKRLDRGAQRARSAARSQPKPARKRRRTLGGAHVACRRPHQRGGEA